MMLGEGRHGRVVDNFDGTVSKTTLTEEGEVCMSSKLQLIDFKYVSNYLKIKQLPLGGQIVYCLVKEKINKGVSLPSKIKDLEKSWDDSLLQSNPLFTYINNFLESPTEVRFEYMRAVIYFHRYLYTTNQKILPLFLELLELVQELKDNNIYFIDWNEENFGSKNNHLALFELGGAKIK